MLYKRRAQPTPTSPTPQTSAQKPDCHCSSHPSHDFHQEGHSAISDTNGPPETEEKQDEGQTPDASGGGEGPAQETPPPSTPAPPDQTPPGQTPPGQTPPAP
ncbi:MAG: hypothetical protein AAF570_28460, partial [Bacteroidota bacterium]